MKRILLISVLFIAYHLGSAQDTIVKRDGDKLIVKLLEVNPTDIKYKRFDYQTGPTFTIMKEQVKYIVYSNGVTESFESYVTPAPKETVFVPDLSIMPSGSKYFYKEHRIGEEDMVEVAKKLNNKKVNLIAGKLEEKKYIQYSALGGAIVLGISGLYVYGSNLPKIRKGYAPSSATVAQQQGQTRGLYIMAAAVASELVSVTFKIERRRHARMLVGAYNEVIGK